MNYVLSMAQQYSNYSMINTSNLYNFLYITLLSMTKEEQMKYIDNMTLIMGQTFKSNLKYYIFSKFPNSEVLKII
jgi:hypothetical protein